MGMFHCWLNVSKAIRNQPYFDAFNPTQCFFFYGICYVMRILMMILVWEVLPNDGIVTTV